MIEAAPNQYERAFEAWLKEHRIDYVAMDEGRRASSGDGQIKTFDFLLYLANRRIIIAEVKGRVFKGTSLAGLKGMECWVTAEDIDGLGEWQRIFGENHKGVLFFAYRIEKVDVDYDGRVVFEFDGDRYVFLAVTLDDYVKGMKRRSPSWQTVTLGAETFRKVAAAAEDLLG
jgi:hypothetical protein